MQGRVGSIVSYGANAYCRKKTMENEIVFVMLTCIQSTPAFPSGEGTAAGAWNAHLHLIAEVKKKMLYLALAVISKCS